ncbi:MAG: serine/threonine-protein kinase [Bacteroidetes bacterium]|nr:serine/threonine-protein kinase [Bacteroidota bacterium]
MEVTLQSFRKRFTYDPAKDLLGKGGFGEVYKAYDNEDHIFVALKISQGTADDKYNLISEIKRFKKLNHPNIVKHIEAYEVNTGSSDIHGKPIAYHVGILEYANNGTLADLLKKGTPDYRLIEDLAKDIIEGLAYLHSENIIHRDLKPTNILLFSEGEKLRAKITDFGIAKRTDATAASTQLVGTVEYMAPEFFSTGNITPAADVWSLGVMLLEALTGTHPFGKTTQGLSNEQIINNILNKDLGTATQNLHAPFKQIVTRCLLRETNIRPQSAMELKSLLQVSSDAFAEKTQVISIKLKKTAAEKPKSILRALFDFDLRNGNWKKVIAREFLLALGLPILIGLVFVVLMGALYFSTKPLVDSRKAIICDLVANEGAIKINDIIVKPPYCGNYSYAWIFHRLNDQTKIGYDKLYALFLKNYLDIDADDLVDFIFTPLGSSIPNFVLGFSLIPAILLYPIRFSLVMLLWAFGTLGFRFQSFSERKSKAVKYSLLLLLLLSLVGFFIYFFVSIKKNSELVQSIKYVSRIVPEEDLPDNLRHQKPAKLPTPQEIFGKDDASTSTNESEKIASSKKSSKTKFVYVIAKITTVTGSIGNFEKGYHAHFSRIYRIPNFDLGKKYQVIESIKSANCFYGKNPDVEVYEFNTLESASEDKSAQSQTLFGDNSCLQQIISIDSYYNSY